MSCCKGAGSLLGSLKPKRMHSEITQYVQNSRSNSASKLNAVEGRVKYLWVARQGEDTSTEEARGGGRVGMGENWSLRILQELELKFGVCRCKNCIIRVKVSAVRFEERQTLCRRFQAVRTLCPIKLVLPTPLPLYKIASWTIRLSYCKAGA